MDNNRKYSEWENEQMNYRPKPRNQAENHRESNDQYRNRNDQNRQDQGRSNQYYRHQSEDSGRNQGHYGNRSDSAYRNPERINYGDNHGNQRYSQQQNDYRQDRNINQRDNRNEYRRNQGGYGNQQHDYYNNPPQGDHAGTRFWGEREGYKEDDYRYTSGHRHWETPGVGRTENDDTTRNQYRQDNRYRQDDRDRGFFDRMGDSVSQAWNNLTGNDDDNDYNHRRAHNRDFNQGYESGPRWANDNDDRYDRDRPNRRAND